MSLPGDANCQAATQVVPDGPVRHGRCSRCGEIFDSDIYRYRGEILCGDCRYYVRHGRWPNYDRTPGANFTTADEIIVDQEWVYHGDRVSEDENP